MPTTNDVNPYQAPREEAAEESRKGWPLWVRMGLFGIRRNSAWLCIWLCLACAAGCVVWSLLDPRFYRVGFVGPLFIVGALWYYLAIRWADKNSRWS
jgi:hypothetical protein